MNDLISRAAAIDAIKPLLYSGNCVSTLINMPAVDAVLVVHGRWEAIDDCGVTRCSACKWNFEGCIDYSYCPNCGAKMDGERRDENADNRR